MKKNKVIVILAFLLLCISVPNFAQAQKTAVLQGETEILKPGDTFEIPVTLSNNPGIMGFMITVEVDEANLVIESVESGELTGDGLFDHNLGLKAGSFDILWSHTENVKKDGVVFYLKGRVAEKANGDISIPISYSQADTFNEQFEDVKIECTSILLKLKQTETKSEGKEVQTESQEEEYKENSKEEIDSEITKVIQSTDRRAVTEAIDEILDEYQQKDFSSADRKTKKKMQKKVYKALQKLGVEKKEIERITKGKSSDEQSEFLEKLYQKSQEDEEKKQEIAKAEEQLREEPEKEVQKNNHVPKIVVCIVLFLLVTSIILVLLKRKREK